MIKISHIEVSPFATNCFLVMDEQSKKAALIDPGDSPDEILGMIERNSAEVVYIMATHCHLDHISAAMEMTQKLNLGFMANEKDKPILDVLTESCVNYGLKPAIAPKIAQNLDHGDELQLGNETLKIFHVPGHSPGSVAIQAGGEDIIVGDLVFAGSIGRTDLPGGDMETIANSIMNIILPLGDEMRLHPGHGPATTIAFEKECNQFIRMWAEEN